MGKPAPRKSLTPTEKDAFFERHLPHRLTLLRAFRDREDWGGDWRGRGDIFRCLEESALISIRLFIEALGLQGVVTGSTYLIKRRETWQVDDVWIEDLGGKPLTDDDLKNMPVEDRAVLGALWCWANKELAHLTSEFATQNHDKHNTIRRGIDVIEKLLCAKLYAEVGKQLPPITSG
jgi:hypothetical protein